MRSELNSLDARYNEIEQEFENMDCSQYDHTSTDGWRISFEPQTECDALRDECFRIEGRMAELTSRIRVYCTFGVW